MPYGMTLDSLCVSIYIVVVDFQWSPYGPLVNSTCISQASPKHSQWLLFGFLIDYFRISYGTPLNSSWISQGFPMESQGIARGCPMDLLRVATTRLMDVLQDSLQPSGNFQVLIDVFQDSLQILTIVQGGSLSTLLRCPNQSLRTRPGLLDDSLQIPRECPQETDDCTTTAYPSHIYMYTPTPHSSLQSS